MGEAWRGLTVAVVRRFSTRFKVKFNKILSFFNSFCPFKRLFRHEEDKKCCQCIVSIIL